MFIKHSPPLPRRIDKRTQRIPTPSPTLESILIDVCNCFNQDIEMIKSKRRCIEYVNCRRIYSYVAHVLTNEACYDVASLINRNHTTYLDRVEQCFGWFGINEADFIEDWNAYTTRSIIWREYYLLKKQALIEGCPEYIKDLKKEEIYWKKQVKQAKEQKRKWELQLKEASEHKNLPKIEVAKSNVQIYKNRFNQAKQCLACLKLQFHKFTRSYDRRILYRSKRNNASC